jgi:hypothetical protein
MSLLLCSRELMDKAVDDLSTLVGETYDTNPSQPAALSDQTLRRAASDVMPRRDPKMERKRVAASAIRGFDPDQHDCGFYPAGQIVSNGADCALEGAFPLAHGGMSSHEPKRRRRLIRPARGRRILKDEPVPLE